MFVFAPALAATLEVGPGGHATLADALAVAVDGDILDVTAPTLSEQVTIGALRVEIRSSVGTVWTGPLTTQLAFLDIRAGADVVVRGIDFVGDAGGYAAFVSDGHLAIHGADLTGFRGAFVVSGGRLDVADCALHDWWYGAVLAASGTGEVRLFRTRISDGSLSEAAAVIGSTATLRSRGSSWARLVNRSGVGGAVFCSGTCSHHNDRFVGNGAFNGAAIFGPAVVTRGLFCGNEGSSVLHGPAEVHNSAFLDNQGLGSGVVVVDGTEVTLSHDTFVDNGGLGAAMVLSVDGDVRSSGNVFASNDGSIEALHAFGTGTISSRYDAFFDNAAGDANFALDGTDLVGVDPLLRRGVGCGWHRVRPEPGSPLVDAGDPAETDPDGSPADLGATGGPGAR